MAVKRAEVAAAKASIPEPEMRRRSTVVSPPRDFVSSLKSRIDAGEAAVIAEIKRASPSKGLLREQFDPAEIARSYAAGGPACLGIKPSILQGAPEHLAAARAARALPALRKDFFDPYRVLGRARGAGLHLLIAACLSASG